MHAESSHIESLELVEGHLLIKTCPFLISICFQVISDLGLKKSRKFVCSFL